MAPSSYRDRTLEFHAIVDRLKNSHSAIATSRPLTANGSMDVATKVNGPRPSGSLQSEFNRKASRIGLSIHQTSQKLVKLAKLAKRTSMFDDPVVEIQELTAVIKQDITALNAAISDLQSLCKFQNESGNNSKHSNDHSVTVVDNLKSRLMNTTKEFKEVLTMRTENLKVHENRRQLFSTSASKDKGSPFIQQGALALPTASTTAVEPPPWANGLTSSQVFTPRWQTSAEGSSTSSLQQTQQLVPIQDSYMQNRAEALQNVESTIMELSNIFTQLATMVAQHGELAIRIDENIDDTFVNVEGAQGALLKYLNNISSNRWLIIKIFCVLIVFLLIFVIFVA
eukprot:c23712_g1_i3 orf=483-1502(+)